MFVIRERLCAHPVCTLRKGFIIQHFGLTLRVLMSYIYGAPILDVSRSNNDAAQSVGLLWTSDQLVAETST